MDMCEFAHVCVCAYMHLCVQEQLFYSLKCLVYLQLNKSASIQFRPNTYSALCLWTKLNSPPGQNCMWVGRNCHDNPWFELSHFLMNIHEVTPNLSALAVPDWSIVSADLKILAKAAPTSRN